MFVQPHNMHPPKPVPNRKDIFLAAARGERPERVPVWIMRQAGRYMPGYRRIRERFSFLEVAKTPELAAEVSLESYERLGVDAIIVFSDILIVAEAMGLPLEIPDEGPKLGNPVRDREGVRSLREFDPARATGFVGEAIRAICTAAGPDVPVLGFAAAPWTLACYMVEGRTRGELALIKRMMYAEPAVLRELLEKIAHATALYLKMQLAAGATAVQIFDTWAGELRAEDYEEFALPATQQLIAEIHAGDAPVILYAKNGAHLLPALGRSGATVLSVDWRTDLADARAALGSRLALQGNVDPAVLLGPAEGIRNAVRETIGKTRGTGHILNLGHGILPQTTVENAHAFVSAAREFSSMPQGQTEKVKVTGPE
jgi:uroporphyrinogen decarboxylase